MTEQRSPGRDSSGAISGALAIAPENQGENPSREIQVSRGDASLCFLLNRRTAAMRIIDFRSGAQPQKLELIREVARAEGMTRAYTVVEREESTAWARLGFVKEGTIPGFYKRSDGHLLGLALDQAEPGESTTRIRVADAPKSGADRGERAYQQGRKMFKARGDSPLPRVKVSLAREQDRDKAMALAVKNQRDLTDFSAFGRDPETEFFLMTARGGFSVLVSVEQQPCFDNAFLELLSGPRGDKETWMIAGGLKQLCGQLETAGVVSLFAMTPAENADLAAILLAAGFRKTGRLPGHLVAGGARVDAHLWSCKLAEPG